jgi:hypothetical protein
MASNFKIFRHQNSENLHFKLFGDFDGTSAYELLNAIKSINGNKCKIFIHTGGLKSVHPFGAELFKRRCHTLPHQNIIITGEYAPEIEFSETCII